MNKDNKVLIYSTRAISSIYSKLLVEQMNIVENFADDIHIMTHTKTDKSYKLAKEISNLNNLKYFKSGYLRFYTEDVIKEKKFNSWDEWDNKLKHCKNVFMQIKDFSIKGL